jgi:hypothetical protein
MYLIPTKPTTRPINTVSYMILCLLALFMYLFYKISAKSGKVFFYKE